MYRQGASSDHLWAVRAQYSAALPRRDLTGLRRGTDPAPPLDAVATRLLRSEERGVRACDQGVGLAVPRQGPEPDAGRDSRAASRVGSGDGQAHPLGDQRGALLVRSREQQRKLIAPVAEAKIAVADGCGDGPRRRPGGARRRPGARARRCSAWNPSRSSMTRTSGWTLGSAISAASRSSNAPRFRSPVSASVSARVATARSVSAFRRAIDA